MMRAVPPDPRTPPPRERPAEGGPAYDETLWVPLRWWAVATTLLASVLIAFLVALPLGIALAGVGVLALATVALFVGYGRVSLRLHDGTFQAGRARIPVVHLAAPEALDEDATRRAFGVEADARAFLLLRPYLRRSVRVHVLDPEDPVPYWLVSSRHPDRLADALAAAIDAEPGHPPV
jgi:hypothetical protein